MTRKISVNLTDTIETWRQATNSMSSYVGEPDQLLTTNKVDIVSAINEIAPQVTTATIRSLQTLAAGGTGSHTTLVYDSNSGAWQFNCNTISQSDLGPLSTSAITSGVFPVARIPNLSANKITSGVFNKARIPYIENLDGQLSPTQVGFVSDDVPEGTSNIYYTDSLARSALSGSTNIAYSQLTGVIQTSVPIPTDISQLQDEQQLISGGLPKIYVDSTPPGVFSSGTFWYDDVRNIIQIRNAAGDSGTDWAKIGHIDSGGTNLNILDSTNVVKILAQDSVVNIGRLTIQDSSVWTAGTSTLETLVSPYNIAKAVAGAGGGGGGSLSNIVEDSTPQLGGDLDGLGNKVLFANVYANLVDLPSASTYHGMFAHVHATGKAYFAHAGAWVRLADYSEVGGGGGGGGAVRTLKSITTGSIASGAHANIDLTGAAKSYMLLKARVSAPSWLRIYTSAAARTADASRGQMTDPTPNSGVIAEILHPTSVGGSSGYISFTPAVPGWNDSSSTTIYMAIRNLPQTGSNTITVDLQYLPLEA